MFIHTRYISVLKVQFIDKIMYAVEHGFQNYIALSVQRFSKNFLHFIIIVFKIFVHTISV